MISLNKMEKLKSILPLTSQTCLAKLGMWCSERLSVENYFLMESLDVLISDVGEDYVKKKCKETGKDWDKTKEVIEKMRKLMPKVKTFYDAISNKTFEKKEDPKNKLQNEIKKYFKKYAIKVSLIQKDIYDLFILLAKNTPLGRQTIRAESFKILEHLTHKKIEYGKKRFGEEAVKKE